MAATSTYINLSNSVLLEYQYRDQASIVDEFTTTQAPWFLMNDDHDNSTLIFNNDDSTNITGNVRTRMGCSTEPTTATYGYLKLNQIMALNDYDPQLTNSVSLPVSFSPMEVVAYDVVRIHLVQGFNFENNEGFYFRLGFNDNAGNVIRHLNLAYRKSDNYAQLNSSPFILGGKYYASYIEIKVPALYNLQDEWYQAISTGSLQKSGGNFTLSAEADFGSSFGIKSSYFKSGTASAASSGILRLSSADSIKFRNIANNGDLSIDIDSDKLRFNSVELADISSAQTLSNKTLSSPIISGSATGNITGNVTGNVTGNITGDYFQAYNFQQTVSGQEMNDGAGEEHERTFIFPIYVGNSSAQRGFGEFELNGSCDFTLYDSSVVAVLN